MGVREIKTTLAIDGEQEFKSALADAQRELRLLGSELKLNTSEFGSNATSMKATSERAKILKKETEQQKEIIRSLSNAVEESAKAYGDADKRTDGYRIKLNNAQVALNRMQNELEAVNKELKTHDKFFENLSKKLTGWGDNITKAGKHFMGLTTAVAGAGIASIKTAADFRDGMNKVNTLDLSASQDKINGIKEDVLALSTETGIAATDIAEATYQMGSALGELKDDTVDFVSVASKAAIGGFTDTSQAVNGLTTVMNAYGLSTAQEMERISDQMLMAQNLGKTTFGEIASSVGNVVPIFKQAGGSTEELFAAYAILTKNGIATSQATTGLKAALSNVIKPSSQAAVLAESLGLNFSASAIQANGLSGFLHDLRGSMQNVVPTYMQLMDQYTAEAQKLQKLEEQKAKSKGTNKELTDQINDQKRVLASVEKEMTALASATDSPIASYASLFGSVEALNSLLVLASDEGIKQFDGAVTSMGDSAGATQTAYEKMQDGFNTETTKMLNSIKNLGIQIGDQLIPKVQPLLAWIQNAVDGFSHLDKGTQEMIVTAALLAAGIGPVLIAVGKLTSTIGSIVSVIPGLLAGFSALAAHPVGLALVAIAAVASGLAIGFASLSSDAKKLEAAVKDAANSIEPFGDSVRALSPDLVNIQSLLSSTGKTLSDLESESRTIENEITTVLANALKSQSGLRQQDIEDIKNYTAKLLAIQQEKLQMYRDQQVSELRKIELESNGISQEAAAQRLRNAQEALNQVNRATEDAYSAQLTIIENKHKAMGTVGSEAYKQELQDAKRFYDQAVSENKSYYTATLNTITEMSRKWIQEDADKWNTLTSKQKLSAKEYANTLSQMNLDAANAFLSMVATTIKSGGQISEETRSTAKSILSAFDNLPRDLRTSGENALRGLVRGMESEIPSLAGASSMSADEITSTLRNELGIRSPSRVTQSMGAYLVQGLFDGMQNNLRWIKNQIKSWVGNVVDFMKGLFGIRSPSTVMRDEIGKNLAFGMADGLKAGGSAVQKAFNGIIPDQKAFDELQYNLNTANHTVNRPPIMEAEVTRKTDAPDVARRGFDLHLECNGKEWARLYVPYIEAEQGRAWRRDLVLEGV